MSKWLTSYKGALAASKRTSRPILANFTGSDWCGWCMRLAEEVFDTDTFSDWAKTTVVLLTIDFPDRKRQTAQVKAQNKRLQEKHKVEGYPTVIFLDSAGARIGESGYESGGAKRWIARAERILSASRKRSR
ncbi:MAG: thioredoxin family protein [Deltaproteobacteria bacterium]|nr:thioredoxin family protein [Deltaproteobacteria bacterium]